MIAEGRVTLNGQVLTSPAVNVRRRTAITVDGEPLPPRSARACGSSTSPAAS